MKLNDALSGVRRLGFDTSPLIYFIEEHPRYVALVAEVVRRITQAEISGITSVVTLSEVLVRPLSHQDLRLQQRYRGILLNSVGFDTCPIDTAVAERAAGLRVRYGLRLPDALQVAVAIGEGCQALLTNDRRLGNVTDLRVLILDDLELA